MWGHHIDGYEEIRKVMSKLGLIAQCYLEHLKTIVGLIDLTIRQSRLT